MSKITNFLDSLDHEVTTNKKTLFFEILAAIGIGVIIGAIFAPNVDITIGSNNIGKLEDDEDDQKNVTR